MTRLATTLRLAVTLAIGVPLATSGLAAEKWFETSTAHFVVRTDTSQTKAERLALELEGRALAFAETFGAAPEWQFPIAVFVFDKAEMFLESLPRGLESVDRAAYLVRGPDRPFVVARDKSPEDLLDAVGHAIGHEFIRHRILWRPFWFDEAAGEYFRKLNAKANTKAVDEKEIFDVSDLLEISPSSSYNDADAQTPFRTQAYRLLRVLIAADPGVGRTLVSRLRRADGRESKPVGDSAALDSKVRTYSESPLVAPLASPDSLRTRELSSEEWGLARADLFMAAGRYTEAGQWCTGETEAARAARAVLARLSRPPEEARRLLSSAARDLPGFGLVQFYFGSLEGNNTPPTDAQIAALEKAVALLPRFGRAHAALARAYGLTGKIEKAPALFDRALALEPEFADRFEEGRADAMLAAGRFDEAMTAIRLAGELPHLDRTADEYYARRSQLIARRIEQTKRAADSTRVERFRENVRAKALQLEPPKRPALPEAVPEGRITYEVEAGFPIEAGEPVYPEYSEALRKMRKAGTITVRLTLGPDGVPTAATVFKSDLPELDAAALEAARKWSFKVPARPARAPVPGVRLSFIFALDPS